MSPLERYIAPGGRRRGLWRPLAGVVTIAAFWIGGTFATLFLWAAVLAARDGDPASALGGLTGTDAGAGGPALVVVALLTFAGIWLGVLLVVRCLHGQQFLTLFAPERRVRGGDFTRGLLVAACFAVAALPFSLLVSQPGVTTLSAPVWLGLLVPVAALIFVQATAEELIFRGYLLQQLALRSRNPLVWAVLPSALFGALHFANTPAGRVGLLYVGTTFLMGLALAALVWRTGSLWAAVGLHVGFNMIGLSVIGTEGMMSGTQLLLFPAEDMPAVMGIDLVMTALLLAFVLSPWAPFGPPAGERAAA